MGISSSSLHQTLVMWSIKRPWAYEHKAHALTQTQAWCVSSIPAAPTTQREGCRRAVSHIGWGSFQRHEHGCSERNSLALKGLLKQKFLSAIFPPLSNSVLENKVNTEGMRGKGWRKRGRNLMRKVEHCICILILTLPLDLISLYSHLKPQNSWIS